MEPTVRSFSADFDPLELVARHPETYPALLETSAPLGTPGGGGRYDVLPIAIGESLRRGADGRLTGPHAAGGGFLTALDAWWRTLRLPETNSPLPWSGGWLIYLGYELAAEIEPCLHLPASLDPVSALAIRTPAAWIRDRATGTAWLVAEPDRDGLLQAFEAHVQALATAEASPTAPSRLRGRWRIEEEPPERFLAAVGRALEYIGAGEIYQANLSRRWRLIADQPPDPLAVYRRLRSTNPSPFAAVLRQPDFAVLSSSPERLVSIRDGRVSTRPIAGTRPRGATVAEDAALVRTLLGNEKERAEHVMLIDLERNDLGRVCEGGSVQVDEYMVPESYAHVHHIVSNVTGRLRAGVAPVEVIRALFPGGTITGCPKVRCMQIIAELEAVGRGAYTGSIGYLNRDGSCDLNILIRTLSVGGAAGAALTFRAGAGIVADSDPGRELEETRAKALGMLRALEADA